MNLYCGMNSGWYSPSVVRLPGVAGIFMINEDGSLYFEQRIIKIKDDLYKIEHLCNEGFNIFFQKYLETIDVIG